MFHSLRRRRLAAGLAVAAVTTATTLLGAAPAYAQTNVVTVRVLGGNLSISGTAFRDNVFATGNAGKVTLSNLAGPIKADGFGCTQAGVTVDCTGMTRITFSGVDGNDTFRNLTPVQSGMFGGNGDDVLRGGRSNLDFAVGGNGFDTCVSEGNSGCEA